MHRNVKLSIVSFFVVLVIAIGVLIGQQTMPLGPYGNLPFTDANTAIGTATISGSQLVGLLVGTPVAAANYTTDTAANLCSLFPFVGTQNATAFAWDLQIKNTSGGANTITVLGGTGVTVVGTATVAQNQVRLFKFVVSGCGGASPAARVYSLETAAF